MTDGSLDLAGLLAELAADLDGAEGTTAAGTTTYTRAGTAFARVAPGELEVRLPADIADAAVRTPDTAVLEDPGWVRFAPSGGEQHVLDRAAAWFRTAWRHAGDR